jgi:hypothetical protein
MIIKFQSFDITKQCICCGKKDIEFVTFPINSFIDSLTEEVIIKCCLRCNGPEVDCKTFIVKATINLRSGGIRNQEGEVW